MRQRYLILKRAGRPNYYCEDTLLGTQTSLGIPNKSDAQRIIHAKNEAEYQPAISLQIARAYQAANDSQLSTRTWQFVMDEGAKIKEGPTKDRWKRAMQQKAFAPLRHLPILDTRPEHFLAVLKKGTVCTNMFLRRLQNFALGMGWLPWPVLPKKLWPKVEFKEKRGITAEEHHKILAGESNPELRDYYELLWHLGGAQTDVASLRAEDIDWTNRTICYDRDKNGNRSSIRFGDTVAKILQSRPKTSYLFPKVVKWKESDRAKAFSRRCSRTSVTGVSLHSYRYAWAERAKTCAYPERYAQLALGHKSSAVHRAYARNAPVQLPPLEDYEKAWKDKIVSIADEPKPSIERRETVENFA
jgi:integrase